MKGGNACNAEDRVSRYSVVTICTEEIETLTARYRSGFFRELYNWQVKFDLQSSTAELIVYIYCPEQEQMSMQFDHSIRIDQETLKLFLTTQVEYDLGISSSSERMVSIQSKTVTKDCTVCGNLAVAEFEPIWECVLEQIRPFLSEEQRSHCDHRNRVDYETAKIEWSRPWKGY